MARRMYEIRANGLVPTGPLEEELGDIDIAQHERRTVLSGEFVDRAALDDFLGLLRSHGLEIIDVRRLPLAGADDQAEGEG